MSPLSTSKKVKILLVGPVHGRVDILEQKLHSLQKSKAGPFDVCFCVGPFGSNVQEMPLPVYVQQYSGTVVKEQVEKTEHKDNADDETAGTSSSPTELATNLYFLGHPEKRAADIYSIAIGKKSLIVASCAFTNMSSTSKEEMKPLHDKVNHVSFVGCDFLLTEEWPQGIQNVLPPFETDASVHTSFDVADLALKTRPRYHVAVGSSQTVPVFCQSAPFEHLQSSTSTGGSIEHCGRFLALAPIQSPEEFQKLDKKKNKFVHALGLIPLFDMTSEELQQDSSKQKLEPCPYTDASYERDEYEDAKASSNNDVNIGFSEAQARRIMAEESSNNTDYRWKSKRQQRQQQSNENDDDNSSTTLFCHGLHKDVSGVLQTGSVALLQAFHKHGILKVRRPPSASSYAFLEFATHEEARRCLEELGGEIIIHGIHLTLKWATSSTGGGQGGSRTSDNINRKRRMTEAEAQDSSTLYFRLPPKILSNELESATEDLRILMQQTLEVALAQDDDDGEKVTAETEPALRVKSRRVDEEKNFGFLEFASHVAASMALATLTGSTDGGVVLLQDSLESLLKEKSHLLGVALHWAQDAKVSEYKKQKTDGLAFERRHFPPDSRTDCWFCLASPTCERHLIVSVHDECYVAMPKGAVHDSHSLIVPVAHTSRGVFMNSKVAIEVEELLSKLAEHAAQTCDGDLFVFERAIQTKGGYHTHVQCIPVEQGIGPKLILTMTRMAQNIRGFDLKEINTDLSLSAILTQEEDEDENLGYFYAEVRYHKDGARKRFLFKANKIPPPQKEEEPEMIKKPRSIVPLQFGREVFATVLNNPDFAHWKACVKTEEEETEMTLAFRKSFEAYTE